MGQQSRSRVPSGQPPRAPSRVPSRQPPAPQIRQPRDQPPSRLRQGKNLVSFLATYNEYQNYVLFNVHRNDYIKEGLEAIIIEKNLNWDKVNRMMQRARTWASNRFTSVDQSKDWWRRNYETPDHL